MTINLNQILKVISNETRLNILQWLKNPGQHFSSKYCDVNKKGVCVGLIEQKTGLSQSTVSQYLALMQQAGLLVMEREGQWTYCKLNEKNLKQFMNELKRIIL